MIGNLCVDFRFQLLRLPGTAGRPSPSPASPCLSWRLEAEDSGGSVNMMSPTITTSLGMLTASFLALAGNLLLCSGVLRMLDYSQ